MYTLRVLITITITMIFSSSLNAEEIIEESAALAQIQQLGGQLNSSSPMAISVALEPVPFLTIPFWTIVIPLVLIATYLLLVKPRRALARISDDCVHRGN